MFFLAERESHAAEEGEVGVMFVYGGFVAAIGVATRDKHMRRAGWGGFGCPRSFNAARATDVANML